MFKAGGMLASSHSVWNDRDTKSEEEEKKEEEKEDGAAVDVDEDCADEAAAVNKGGHRGSRVGFAFLVVVVVNDRWW